MIGVLRVVPDPAAARSAPATAAYQTAAPSVQS